MFEDSKWPDLFITLKPQIGKRRIVENGTERVIDEDMGQYVIHTQTEEMEGDGKLPTHFGFVSYVPGQPILQSPGVRNWPDELKEQVVSLVNTRLVELGGEGQGSRTLAPVYGKWPEDEEEIEDDADDLDE